MSATKAQTILSDIVDMIGADVALLAARVGEDGKRSELCLDDARRVAVYADRLEAIVRHEKTRPLRDANLSQLLERVKQNPELMEALTARGITIPAVPEAIDDE